MRGSSKVRADRRRSTTAPSTAASRHRAQQPRARAVHVLAEARAGGAARARRLGAAGAGGGVAHAAGLAGAPRRPAALGARLRRLAHGAGGGGESRARWGRWPRERRGGRARGRAGVAGARCRGARAAIQGWAEVRWAAAAVGDERAPRPPMRAAATLARCQRLPPPRPPLAATAPVSLAGPSCLQLACGKRQCQWVGAQRTVRQGGWRLDRVATDRQAGRDKWGRVMKGVAQGEGATNKGLGVVHRWAALPRGLGG